ncbi:MAG: hypothetical protein ACR2P0_20990 [Acidimicrobiales bacterium]
MTEPDAAPRDRIPQAVRERAAAARAAKSSNDAAPAKPASDATGAKIIAAGASVAAGIGLVGTMAVLAAAPSTPSVTPAPAPATRVIVVQQPVVVGGSLPGPVSAAEAPPMIVIETQATATPEPAAPMTQTQGS